MYDGYSDSKLFKVNFTSLMKCGTIEFRQHGGANDITEIIMWIRLLLRFCSIAIDEDSPPPLQLAQTDNALDTLFNLILQDQQITDYYLKRMGVYEIAGFQTRPVFLYGTLMAAPLLALIVTGNQSNHDFIAPLLKKAILHQYRRSSVLGKDYPALVKGAENDIVKGLVFYPRNIDDRRKINNFEGENYSLETVKVALESGEQVEASSYIWAGEHSELSNTNWDFTEFELHRLSDWLDLFEGMEFT